MIETDFNELALLDEQHQSEAEAHNTEHHAEAEHAEHTDSHGHAESEDSGEFSFMDLLNSNSGDHAQLSWYDFIHIDLPKIIIDDGVHVYKNTESMEAGGLYTYSHHKIVNADTHEAPMLDMSVTSLVVFQWLAVILLAVAFFTAKKHYKKNPLRAPRGFAGMMESIVIFIREDIAVPNLGKKLGDKLLPFLLGIFSFILVMNLFGLIPGGHTPTSNIAVTGVLAIIAFLVIQGVSISQVGIGGWFKNLLGGAPVFLAPIMIPIEIISLFVKPFALAIRLFANMTAGHIVILCLLGLLFVFKMLWISPFIVGFTVFVFALEILVACIQAYIFTMLTAAFIGLSSHGH
ncbi:MAG: ATP synthase F0 subunit A [Bacteroidetes bacterium 4572_77]|nr:MAG: ATP synthase F0 subunit A [Bacteroidetes bacterium 4572_77]